MKLPRYQCHKIVQAAKIVSIQEMGGECPLPRLILENPDDSWPQAQLVDPSYTLKHKPQVGGYYVRYEDGYESFSPAEAFEEGYTLIEDEPDTPDDPPAAAPEPEKQTPWKDLLCSTLCGFLLGLTAALIFWCYANTRPDTVAQEKTAEPSKAQSFTDAFNALERAGQPIWRDCLKVDLLAVVRPPAMGAFYYFRAHNACGIPTPRLYVRLSFQDGPGTHLGFKTFFIASLQPNQWISIDHSAAPKGAASAEILDVTPDETEYLKWRK